jgi:hypothetical protein
MFNCSSDDSAAPSETTTQKNTRLISGTWKIISVYENDVPLNLTSCELNSQTIYNTANSTYNDKSYYSNSNGDCLFYDYSNSFRFEDNIIYHYDGNIPVSGTILTLNETTLKYTSQGYTKTYRKQ